MKIGVLLKEVVVCDAALHLDADHGWVQEKDSRYQANPGDLHALEVALAYKDREDTQVVLVSLGLASHQQYLKDALARGADRAVLISHAEPHRLEPLAVAKELAAVCNEEKFDLLLAAVQSDDRGDGQVPLLVAECLRLPHFSMVVEIDSQQPLRAKREWESGYYQWIKSPLPLLMTVQSGINKPRYASMKGVMAAKKKPIEVRATSVAEVSTYSLLSIGLPPKQKETRFLSGSMREIALQLLRELKLR